MFYYTIWWVWPYPIPICWSTIMQLLDLQTSEFKSTPPKAYCGVKVHIEHIDDWHDKIFYPYIKIYTNVALWSICISLYFPPELFSSGLLLITRYPPQSIILRTFLSYRMREFFIAPAELYKFHLYCHTDYIFLAYLNAGILCLPTCLTLNIFLHDSSECFPNFLWSHTGYICQA